MRHSVFPQNPVPRSRFPPTDRRPLLSQTAERRRRYAFAVRKATNHPALISYVQKGVMSEFQRRQFKVTKRPLDIRGQRELRKASKLGASTGKSAIMRNW